MQLSRQALNSTILECSGDSSIETEAAIIRGAAAGEILTEIEAAFKSIVENYCSGIERSLTHEVQQKETIEPEKDADKTLEQRKVLAKNEIIL